MIEAIPDPGGQYPTSIIELECGEPVPAGFNPLQIPREVRAAALNIYNLPQEPDEETDRDLHLFWTKFFPPNLEIAERRLVYSAANPGLPILAARAISMPTQPSRVTRQQSSQNWSGASITPRESRMFTDVMATWEIPTVVVPAADSAADPLAVNQEYKSSCWVGLDGQRAYADSTLPQIGTEQSINKNDLPVGAAAAVWFQWWPMDEMIIPSLPVRFGDTVHCWLTAKTYTQVRCLITIIPGPANPDQTPRLLRFCADAPNIKFSPPPFPVYSPKISGATAEWITEAPTSRAKQRILPLPDYEKVTFRDCYAYSAENPGDPPRVERLVGPTLTRMYKIADNPPRRITTSTADRPDLAALNQVETTFVR